LRIQQDRTTRFGHSCAKWQDYVHSAGARAGALKRERNCGKKLRAEVDLLC
jgi:hypothetical protein